MKFTKLLWKNYTQNGEVFDITKKCKIVFVFTNFDWSRFFFEYSRPCCRSLRWLVRWRLEGSFRLHRRAPRHRTSRIRPSGQSNYPKVNKNTMPVTICDIFSSYFLDWFLNTSVIFGDCLGDGEILGWTWTNNYTTIGKRDHTLWVEVDRKN